MSPKNSTSVLLERAVDLMFEIYLLRGDCSATTRALMSRGLGHEEAIEDCARLDDTLAKAYRSLQQTVRAVQVSRAKRKKTTGNRGHPAGGSC